MHAYDQQNAQLTLRDQYPATSQRVPTAFANVDSIIETLNHELLEVGAWLNVVGYVIRALKAALIRSTLKERASSKDIPTERCINATMIWSAGAVKLDKYKSAAKDYQQPLSND